MQAERWWVMRSPLVKYVMGDHGLLGNPDEMKCSRHPETKFRSIRYTKPNGSRWLNNKVQVCERCVEEL